MCVCVLLNASNDNFQRHLVNVQFVEIEIDENTTLQSERKANFRLQLMSNIYQI